MVDATVLSSGPLGATVLSSGLLGATVLDSGLLKYVRFEQGQTMELRPIMLESLLLEDINRIENKTWSIK